MSQGIGCRVGILRIIKDYNDKERKYFDEKERQVPAVLRIQEVCHDCTDYFNPTWNCRG